MVQSAEFLLKSLQDVLLEAAQMAGDEQSAGKPAQAARQAQRALRAVERSYGPSATRYGRMLSELVSGSSAWDLFPELRYAEQQGPRIYELCQCEPVLHAMRSTGELAAREKLLEERNARFSALWQDGNLTDEDRRYETEALYADYFESVARISATYRPRYDELKNTAHGYVAPLPSSRIRASVILQPPLMALLFSACHMKKDGAFAPISQGGQSGMELRQGTNALQIVMGDPADIPADNLGTDRDAIQAWAGALEADLDKLDETMWDIAAISISCYFARTGGQDPDASFPLLIDDYFNWRGVDPRKRTAQLRKEIDARINLLCSDRLQLFSETHLWLTDRASGQRRRTQVITQGPLLVKKSRFFYKNASPQELMQRQVPDGYVLTLGSWAEKFIEERAMLGVFFKRLAEYDLGRQQWERRIGWYLMFQMNNQASKMTYKDVSDGGRTHTIAEPQHALRMKTVLAGSHVRWHEMREANPGKVIKQWCDALETLRRDGLIGEYSCLDGAVDGSDLPPRGRLEAMLDRRYQFFPGTALLPHLRAKKEGARRRLSAPA
ncbi:MAG TPA: hypothetical protein VFW40_10345 [Capsulimonadaceae bacterium]|nr:hypothetical protein [Capsulimonadaceae bacterium]